MPLDAARANAKTEALNTAFASIGKAGDTVMPRSKGNLEPLAWEYLVASHLKRLAEARKKKAHGEAVKAGVIFDHEKQPAPIGTKALVYAGEVVEIAVNVTTPTTNLDLPAFTEELQKYMDQKVINRLLNKHTHENRAPHEFVATLATTR
jgi:hypothetical protein